MVPVIRDENREESRKETERQEGNQKEVLLRYRKSEIWKKK